MKSTFLSFLLILGSLSLIAQDFRTYHFDVYFDSGKDAIDMDAASSIRQKIIELGSSNIREVYLSGHADSDSDDDFNKALSRRRAEHTRNYLMSQGVLERMIQMKSFGESMPVSDDKRLNRRVQITFLYANELPASNGRNVVVIGRVQHGHTGKKMGADYAMEQGGQNLFGQCSRKGEFSLKLGVSDNARVIVSRNGFLSDVKEVDPNQLRRASDTLFLNFKLYPVQVVEKITFKNIYFYTDKDVLKPESMTDLQRLLVMLKSNQELYIQIQGHVNFPMYRELTPSLKIWNHDLSHRRAKAVYDYLIKNGVDPGRLSYIGLSNTRMVHPYPNNQAEADKNKRVEIWKMKKI